MKNPEIRGFVETVTTVRVISARRSRLVVEVNGKRQVVYAGGTLVVSVYGHITPEA